MTSFVDLVLGCVLGVAPISAASPAAPAPASNAPDSTWVTHVTAAVAQRWGIPAESVRLEWGRTPVQGRPPDTSAFQLAGGANGWFVASFVAPQGWAMAARVRAGSDATVLVATRDLARGTRLEAGDLRAEQRIHWGDPERRREGPSPAAGWELRRAVRAGTVVDRPSASPPALVRAGEHIDLWWRRGDVAMRLSGVALHGARLGEPVKVRVDGRPRPLTGIVDAPGSARIGPGEAS
jgi:flagella basal body P-ring formation protein FlgA